MREIVIFGTSVGRQQPPHWQDIALAALQPFGPAKITPSSYGDRAIEFEFDYYPEGLDAVVDQLRRQGISSLFTVHRQYTAAERRQAELLILGGGRIVRSVGDTLRAGGGLGSALSATGAQRTGSSSHCRSRSSPRAAMFALVDHWSGWSPSVRLAGAGLASAAEVTGLELVPVGPERSGAVVRHAVTHRLPPLAIPPNSPVPGRCGLTPRCAPNHLWDPVRQHLPVGVPAPGVGIWGRFQPHLRVLWRYSARCCNPRRDLATGLPPAAGGRGQAAGLCEGPYALWIEEVDASHVGR